jgi:GNAT superfamily N-acetyltransferase
MLDREEQRLRKMWCRDRRWLYLAVLFADPEWQGQGIGSAVIGRVCERADQDGVLRFLQTTKSATGFYERRRWICVESFGVDLGRWVEGEGLGYGVYQPGFCVRLSREKINGVREGKEERA